jgi:CP family cyanate transporter-like MFS transporter
MPSPGHSRPYQVVLALGIFLTALNMRTTIIAIPPLMDVIRADTGLSATATGLVMTLPMICFALLSLAAPAVARRIGLDLTVIAATAPFLFGALKVSPAAGPCRRRWCSWR